MTICNLFLTHPNTASFFVDDGEVDIVYQLPIFFAYKGVNCKALLDMVRVNHKLKSITSLDLKTTSGPILHFPNSVLSFRYDLQAAFYKEALSSVEGKAVLSNIIGRDISDYSLSAFGFIAESTVSMGCPMAFPLSHELELEGKYGRTNTPPTPNILGFDHGITKYQFWAEHIFDITQATVGSYRNIMSRVDPGTKLDYLLY